MRNFWCFYKHPSRPWVKFLHLLHYKRRVPSAGGVIPSICSPLWRGIISTSLLFHTSVAFRVGNGTSASFWHTRWTGDSTLRTQLPALFAAALCKHLSIEAWLRRFGNFIDGGFEVSNQSAADELDHLNSLAAATALSDNPDEIIWRWDGAGRFSASSAYYFLVFDGVDDSRISHLWKIPAPNKIKIFLWLGGRRRLLTADFLLRRGWYGPTICVLCSNHSEDLDHLWFNCSYAREVWGFLLRGEVGVYSTLLTGAESLADRWLRTRKRMGGTRRVLFDACMAATCWHLWLERNKRIFGKRAARGVECGATIIESINQWLHVFRGT